MPPLSAIQLPGPVRFSQETPLQRCKTALYRAFRVLLGMFLSPICRVCFCLSGASFPLRVLKWMRGGSRVSQSNKKRETLILNVSLLIATVSCPLPYTHLEFLTGRPSGISRRQRGLLSWTIWETCGHGERSFLFPFAFYHKIYAFSIC